MTHHVILGGGPAGLGAIETIRHNDPSATITLVCDEAPYSRMALPYFLSAEIPAEQLATASDAYYERMKIDARIGVRALSVDPETRRVALSDGATLDYDTLLVATGSSPQRLPIPGARESGVFTLWTLEDANAVVAASPSPSPSAILIGGGFIGLIVLNALQKLGWKLTLVEREGRILPHMLDRRAADAAEAWLRELGVEVYCGCSATQIEGEPRKRVTLSDGQSLDADMVLLSTGIRPNLDALEGSGLAIEGGIVVDHHCRSSDPSIYAAGDVAAGPDRLGGSPRVHAIQPTAVDHGRIAGSNMSGVEARYRGSLAMNILDIAGLHCASFGNWSDDNDVTTIWAPGGPVYRKLVWNGGRISGGILLGPIDDTTMLTDVGMLKGLVQTQVDLTRWKSFLNEKPWDLRRAYVASRTAEALLGETLTGTAARPRTHRYRDTPVASHPTPHHAQLMGTRPESFDELPRTPTPGIHKSSPGD